jgi:RNA polymerase sigma factor (sigma-70 family)
MITSSSSATPEAATSSDKNRGVASHSGVDTVSESLPFAESTSCAGRDERLAVEGRLRQALDKVCTGNLDALDTVWNLVARDLYSLALWRTGSVEEAEDALQDVFVRLAQRPIRHDRIRNVRSYMLRMVHNAAVDAARRRESPVTDDTPELVALDAVDEQIDGRRASALLLGLPPAQREVVFLRHFAELSFREIAEVCRISTFTAASRHRLAIARLRKQLGVQP